LSKTGVFSRHTCIDRGGFHDCDFALQCAGPFSARILIHGHRMSRIDLPLSPPPDCEALRAEVRDFIAAHCHGWSPTDRARSWMSYDRNLSLALGARGWIGMTWPKVHGGHERSAIERYTVLEELLAAGAPVGAHWIADRQSGPLILRVGSEAQRRSILPRIAAGAVTFCIGMSEPDSGSDLASIRARARRDGDGWVLSGTKLWTTNAHRSDYMIGLFRTGAGPDERQRGLSQFLIDMHLPGIEARPIADLGGHDDFNQVTFDDVRLPADALLGTEGEGWAQVSSELALERSGPERLLSSFPLLAAATAEAGAEHAGLIGTLVADVAVLRQMSLAVAGMLQAGASPALQAALVKDRGTIFEQEVAERLRPLLAESGGDLATMYHATMQVAPSFTLRGGTTEVLRGIVARGLGVR
jgi:alkylation response protein AidB-like acyl-CoA dehydrogenase